MVVVLKTNCCHQNVLVLPDGNRAAFYSYPFSNFVHLAIIFVVYGAARFVLKCSSREHGRLDHIHHSLLPAEMVIFMRDEKLPKL